MARLLAILLVLGGLGVFLTVWTQGPERAFGGALARFSQREASAPRAAAAPAPRRDAPDWWEQEERRPPQPIGQRVRERVTDAVATGARRHGGE